MSSPTSPAIQACAVHKHFGSTHAVDGVSIAIPKGQICALLGQNGAGKTTFIECALGLTQPTHGSAEVMGHAAGSMDARSTTGVMLQDSDLPDLLTAREHLALFASYFNTPADTEQLIKETDISSFADTRYKKLSGGQKRRVQFALALVGNPDVLFLDEPTTGLDQEAARAVWRNVRRLSEQGKTVLLTTHYLEEADALADRIVVMHHGRVIADGSTEDVRNKVGGALITCQTALPTDALQDLPSVRSVTASGRLHSILTDSAPASLRQLLALDPELTDLTVKKPTLAEAFSALTNNKHEVNS
ncbi:MAG: ABC transporter ATP-binding protein [Pseudomonadota bacterium]